MFDVTKLAFTRNLCIESGGDNENILLSSKENGFLQIDLGTRKLIRSWPIIQNNNLSTSGVFHHGEQKYYAIIQDRVLYSWSDSDSCLSNASMMHLDCKYSIQKLHPIVHKNINDLVLVDSSGKVHLLSNMNKLSESDHKSLIEGKGDNKKRYIWSSPLVQVKSQELNFVAIFEEAQKFKVNVIKLKEINQKLMFEEARERNLTPLSKGSHLISSTVQGSRLMALWSDNTLCSYELNLDYADVDSSPLCKKLILTLPAEFKITGKSQKAKIGTIDADHVFVVFKCTIGEKRSGAVSVWSTKFGTEQARISFPLSLESEKAYREQDILSVDFCHAHVILALSKSVIATSCRIRSSSLAASLGKLKRPRESIEKESNSSVLTSPYIVTPTLRRSLREKEQTKIMIENVEEQKNLERLSDSKKTPTVEDFNRELDAFLRKLRIQAAEKECQAETNEAKTESEEPKTKKRKINLNEKTRNMIVPDRFVQTVLNRCLSDDNLWSSKSIVKILKTSCVSPSLCSELVQKIVEKGSLDIMRKSFQHIKGIPESDILKCVKHILGHKSGESKSDKLKTFGGLDETDEFQLDEKCYKMLLVILKYPFNDYAMQSSLRILDGQETKMLLQIMFQLLLNQVPGVEDQISHEKVVDWLSMIINARFTSLVIDSDSSKLIQRIKETISNQMKLFEKLETLEPFLMYFKNSFQLPTIKTISAYSVDTITI